MIKQKVDISKRYHYNLEICRKLMEYFSRNQEMRFFQAIQNLGMQEFEVTIDGMMIPDNFHEESEITYNKLKTKQNELEK